MKLNSNTLKNIAAINIAIAALFIIDAKLPNYNIKTEIYDSVASIKKSYSGYKYRGYEKIDILYCQDKEYRIGNIPEALHDLQKGDTIKISRTSILQKVSKIGIIKNNSVSWYSLSIITNFYITAMLIIIIVISTTYLFYEKPIIEFLLAFCMVAICFLSLIYLFFY